MLQYEEFFDLQNPEETSLHKIIQLDKDENEDDLESIPFGINYNSLVVDDENGRE